MNAHLSDEQVTLYAEKGLRPADLILIDAHLSTCEACRGRVRMGIPAFLQDGLLGDSEHITYEQLAAYVDNKAGIERHSIAAHLDGCFRCKAEYEDLRSFSKEMSASAASRWPWVAALAGLFKPTERKRS
jgi:anti-sigma factor ChrR (cupin superfamily)